jgi:glycolate oxidase
VRTLEPLDATFLKALQKIFPADSLWTDVEKFAGYARDESDQGEFLPQVVAFASSTAQVSSLFKLCTEHRVPVTPCGARSGKSGGSLPLQGGVALSLERMNAIHAIRAEDLTVTVGPGVILKDLMSAVEERGLFYPPDPNSLEICTLGGNIAENAGGPRALKYGVTRDYVLGLEWVVPTGEVLRVGKQTIKGVAGYDLVGLFVGSEGTLGVATEITLQLLPLPRKVHTALLIFPSTIVGAKAVSAILAAGILPRTLEFLDSVAITAVDGRGFRFPAGTQACVIAEVDGSDDEPLFAEMARLAEVGTQAGATQVLVAQSEAQRRDIWACRRQVSPALRQLKKAKLSEDIVVPRSQIPAMVERTQAIGRELGLMVATYGHAGDGNLHANVLYDGPPERDRADEAVSRIVRTAVELGGTITGEHGVGLAKRDFLPFEQGAALIDLQRRLQRFFDPAGIMNPGKIFPESA